MDEIFELRRRETARQIAEAMERTGMTRVELARKLRRSPSVVTSWLSGKHNFTSDLLAEISEALGVQISGVPLSALVSGYGTVGSCDSSRLKDSVPVPYSVGPISLSEPEFAILSRRAGEYGVSLNSYASFILGKELRKDNVSESQRTADFLAKCAGAWSGPEYDEVEKQIYATRSIRNVEIL